MTTTAIIVMITSLTVVIGGFIAATIRLIKLGEHTEQEE